MAAERKPGAGFERHSLVRRLRDSRRCHAREAYGRKGKALVAARRVLTFPAAAQQKRGATAPLCRICRRSGLTLRELERPASLGATVLLALDHAAVAGEEAAALEHGAQLRLE